MEPEVIYDHPSLTLTHYPNQSCILETWRGYTDFKLFADLLSVTLNLLVEKNAKNLILDTRLHKGLGPDGQEHGVKACSEHAKKYGQMRHAIIVPADVFSKFSVDNFVKKLDKSSLVINHYFQDVEDALRWMNEDL